MSDNTNHEVLDDPANESAAIVATPMVRNRKNASEKEDIESKKEIDKTSQAIRKKYLILKVGGMNVETASEHQTHPIMERLKQLVEKASVKKSLLPPPPAPSASSLPMVTPFMTTPPMTILFMTVSSMTLLWRLRL